MNLHELETTLSSHPDKAIRIQLPDGRVVPSHYHVTEVGHVRKRFIDCGGTTHEVDACVLQTWVATDEDHRVESSKLAAILQLAEGILPDDDLPVEVEYEDVLDFAISTRRDRGGSGGVALSADRQTHGLPGERGLRRGRRLLRQW